MITSLIKVGLLSFVSAIFPFKEVDLTHLSTSDKVILKQNNIKKVYINEYQSQKEVCFDIDDLNSGFFASFENPSNDYYYDNNNINVFYSYDIDGEINMFNIKFDVCRYWNEPHYDYYNSNGGYYYEFQKSTVTGNNVHFNSYLVIDLKQAFMRYYVFREGVLYSFHDVIDIRIPTFADDLYTDLEDYIYNETSITIPQISLNNIQFNLTADYLNSLNDSDLYPRALKSGVVNNGWLDADNKMAFGDSDYWLSLGNNYRGFWLDDGVIGQWNGDLVLYVGNTDIYPLLKANIQNDINGTGLIYGDKFTISYGFNYNAPYNLNTYDTLISDSYFTSDTANTYHKYFDYDMPYFTSNGELFNRVRLEYINAYATRYKIENQSGNVIQFPSGAGEGYGYFAHLWYSNTDSGVERLVYVRKFSQYLDNNNNLQTYLDRGGSWVNTSYQYLDFYNPLNATQRNNLSQLNNIGSLNGLSNGGEVDLSSVFSLISSTLTSFTTFFNIGILPGISLGMLILVPFGITLLLLIISLFKR